MRKRLTQACAFLLCLYSAEASGNITDLSGTTQERLVSRSDSDHGLTNVNVWSGDGQWIVYDIRTNNGMPFDAVRVEAANIVSGEFRVLYEMKNMAGCGVATFNPAKDEVAFILGPEFPSKDWDYSISRRRGVIVSLENPGVLKNLDAMNYSVPFTPGALRGGSHIHVFNQNGKLLSFTYDDEILSRLDNKSSSEASAAQVNQRNVGVAIAERPVTVSKNHPRNNDGNVFSVLVTHTVNKPQPGSDEISRAFEEGWVGTHGYIKKDGSRQHHAIAFQGLVTSTKSTQHPEVFIVDLPDDLTQPGSAPLEGDAFHRPAPPKDCVQRRLTFTDSNKYPGLSSAPRHWLRSSPDGNEIAFVMRDDSGINQLWCISPNGGPPRQITCLSDAGVASAFTWSPDGHWIAIIIDGSVCLVDAKSGRVFRLTPKADSPETSLGGVCIFSPCGRKIAYLKKHRFHENPRLHVFTVDIPESLETSNSDKH